MFLKDQNYFAFGERNIQAVTLEQSYMREMTTKCKKPPWPSAFWNCKVAIVLLSLRVKVYDCILYSQKYQPTGV